MTWRGSDAARRRGRRVASGGRRRGAGTAPGGARRTPGSRRRAGTARGSAGAGSRTREPSGPRCAGTAACKHHQTGTITKIKIRAVATLGWLGSRVVSVLDSGAEGHGFKSQPRRCRVTVLGKLFTVSRFTKQQIGSSPFKGCEGNCRPGGR